MKAFPVLLALCTSAIAFAADPVVPANPHAGMKPSSMASRDANLPQTAKVLNIIKAPPYNYIEASQGKNTIWLATTTIAVKKGDVIRFDEGMVMNDFYSKSLKRTFPSILFVNKLVVGEGK
jgi:hypothetical protein